jgi:hypothetical protein
MMVAHRSIVAAFGFIGAASGAVTTALLFTFPTNWRIEVGGFLEISPMAMEAGLVFGVIIGAVLRHRGLAGNTIAVFYAVAATASYFVAVNLALNLADALDKVWQVGMIAGLTGAACLTALAAWLLPFVRRPHSCALMLVAGCLLGALLEFPIRGGSGFWDWLLLYAPWQAGYAAAFATALPEVRAGSG